MILASRRGTTQWSRQYEGGARYLAKRFHFRCLVLSGFLLYEVAWGNAKTFPHILSSS